MKTQEQVIFEAELKKWDELIKDMGDDITPWQKEKNPLVGPALWWKVKDIKPGQFIVFMPSDLREAKPDEAIFKLPGELECYAYTIDGKEVTR